MRLLLHPIHLFTGKRFKSNQVIFGKYPIINIFCKILQPVINELYQSPHEGYFLLSSSGLWPFSESLMITENETDKKIDDRLELAQKIKLLDQSIAKLSYLLEQDFFRNPNKSSNDDELKKTGETMMLISETLSAITSLDQRCKDIKLCKICFRTAIQNSIYCHEHYPTTQDTSNKRDKRVYQKVSVDYLNNKNKYIKLRSILGPETNYLKIDTLLEDVVFSSQKNYVALSFSEQKLFEQTLNNEWNSIRPYWVQAIHEQLPLVENKVRSSIEKVNSWDEFALCIYSCLGVNIKKPGQFTTDLDPYWILRLMVLAEFWLKNEKKYGDKRLTGIKDEIFKMDIAGFKQVDIASVLNISRSYVSKVLKGNKNEPIDSASKCLNR